MEGGYRVWAGWTEARCASASVVREWEIGLRAEERSRAARLRMEAARRDFAGVRHLARRVAGVATGGREVSILGGAGARPSLSFAGRGGGHWDLSLSHSDGLLAAACAWGARVGIDVERRRDVPDAIEIARGFFSREEAATLERLGLRERGQGFLRLWTRKEAFLKAVGKGLAGGLAAVEFEGAGAAAWRVKGPLANAAETEWMVWEIPVAGGFCALALGCQRGAAGRLHAAGYTVGEGL